MSGAGQIEKLADTLSDEFLPKIFERAIDLIAEDDDDPVNQQLLYETAFWFAIDIQERAMQFFESIVESSPHNRVVIRNQIYRSIELASLVSYENINAIMTGKRELLRKWRQNELGLSESANVEFRDSNFPNRKFTDVEWASLERRKHQ
jgi:hypothetical protein